MKQLKITLIEVWSINHPSIQGDVEEDRSIKVDRDDPVRHDDSSIIDIPPNFHSTPDYYWMGLATTNEHMFDQSTIMAKG